VRNYNLTEKEQIIKEVKETGNITIVAKKHKIPVTTIHGWLKKEKKIETKECSKSVKSREKQLANKDLEIKILKDLLKKTNQAWLKD